MSNNDHLRPVTFSLFCKVEIWQICDQGYRSSLSATHLLLQDSFRCVGVLVYFAGKDLENLLGERARECRAPIHGCKSNY